MRYWIDGKEGMLSLGTYPDVPLKLARERREEARRLVAAGVNPSEHRKAAKRERAQAAALKELTEAGLALPGTFEHAAREWHKRLSPTWSTGHSARVLALLENDVIPYLGRRNLSDLCAPDVLAVARRIESRGAIETAYRSIGIVGMVFRHGVQTGYCNSDPTRHLKGAIALPPVAHRSAVLDPIALGGLLRAIDAYQGSPVVRAALKLAPLVFLRPGELRHGEWREIDFDAARWRIPSARMKGRLKAKRSGEYHVVPLSKQAVGLLRDLHSLTGSGRYVFPGLTADRPLSDNGILSALRRMGFGKDEMSGHGFRATARTLLSEQLGVPSEVIEAQLAHAVGDSLGRAYNRTTFLDRRIEMMQVWASYLDRLRAGGERVRTSAAC